jgi:hypothetical protein
MRMNFARSIVPASLALLALTGVSACNVGDGTPQENANAWTWTGELKAPGTINIRNLNGSIEVRPSTDNAVHITAATRWRTGNPEKDVSFQAIREGTDVTVCAIWGRGSCSAERVKSKTSFNLFGNKNDVNVKFTVMVPTGVKVNALTVNGSVDALSTAPVIARTANGSIKVGTSVGPVDAETVNGDVDARMTTINGEGIIRAATVNGTATLFVPGDVAGRVEISNMNGSVGTDFALGGDESKHNISGVLGAGGREIKVATVNGNAYLRRLNADGTPGGTVTGNAASPTGGEPPKTKP